MQNKMENSNTGHPVLTLILGVIALVTGSQSWFGNITAEDLDFADKLLAVILKGVSIISFLLIVFLNLNKIFKMIKGWFNLKNNG